MSKIIFFIMANFPLTFTIIGLITAGINIIKKHSFLSISEKSYIVLKWFLILSIGVSYFYNFVCHVFFGDISARFIGWLQSPFQAEVGWASLGFSVLGFIAALRNSRETQVGIIIAVACFMWGAAFGHIYQMITAGNFAPGNAGIMFWCDIFMPIFGFLLLWMTRK